jgi:hypothetical protein
MTFKWYRVAGNKEVGTSEDGNIQVTRLPDWQYVVWYRKPPNQAGKVWSWVKDSAGNKCEFGTVEEAVEEAKKQREELLKRAAGGLSGRPSE